MTNRPRIRLAAAVLACVVLAACSGDATADPTATSTCLTASCEENTMAEPTDTPTPAPTPEPTPTPSVAATPTQEPTIAVPAKWQPPDPVTAEYAVEVANELFRLQTPIDQMVIDGAKAGELPSVKKLEDEYSELMTPQRAKIEAGTAHSYGPELILELYSDPATQIAVSPPAEVASSSGDCIVVTATLELEAGPEVMDIHLLSQDSNPTGWAFNSATTGTPVSC